MTYTRREALVAAGGMVAVAGCTGVPDTGDRSLALSSSAFREGEAIPAAYTCDGADESPPLAFEEIPSETGALGLVVEDPDAPGTTFTHWLLWNLPPDRTVIHAGVTDAPTLPSLGGARQGKNGFGTIGYRGPCPPGGGGEHTYRFRAYALDAALDVAPGADRGAVLPALEGAEIATDTLTGTYER